MPCCVIFSLRRSYQNIVEPDEIRKPRKRLNYLSAGVFNINNILQYLDRCRSLFLFLCYFGVLNCSVSHQIILMTIYVFLNRVGFDDIFPSTVCWFKCIYFSFQRVENELFKNFFHWQTNKTIQGVVLIKNASFIIQFQYCPFADSI